MTSLNSADTPIRITLVEDDEQVRESLSLFLRGRGYTVDVFRSGSALLQARKQPESDCLLVDYKLAHIDGLALLRRLRAMGNQTPALMITGYFSNTLHKRALEAGFADVLEKPTSLADLTASITAAVGGLETRTA